MVNIDIPTAVVAVVISAFLSYFRSHANKVTEYWFESKKSEREEAIKWYSELEAIGSEIESFTMTSMGRLQSFEEVEEQIEEDIRNVDLDGVSSDEEYIRRLNEEVQYLGARLPTNVQSTSFHNQYDVEAQQEKVISKAKELMKESYIKSLQERKKKEFYNYYKQLMSHFAHSPVYPHDDLWNAYIKLEIECLHHAEVDAITDDDREKIQELCVDLVEKSVIERTIVEEQSLLRNRLRYLIKSGEIEEDIRAKGVETPNSVAKKESS